MEVGSGFGWAGFGPGFGPNFPKRNRSQSGSIEGTLANNFFSFGHISLNYCRFFCARFFLFGFICMFLFYFFLNNKTGLQHNNIQISSIANLMNRKNYCWAESGFLMRPRFRVGFGLTSSGSGRIRSEPTRPDSISDS